MKRVTALAAVLVLSACGGGGDDGATTSTSAPITTTAAASAEGFWTGTASTGDVVNMAVLETGETWGITTTNSGVLTGALYGNVASSGSTLSGTGSSFSFVSGTSSAGALSGIVSTKTSLSFKTSEGTTFTGTYVTAYDQPALLSNLAGSYSGFAVGGTTSAQSATVVIDVNGNISSSSVSGGLFCNTSGKAVPRASGKNIFDIQLSFSGNYCALGNGATTSGVGYFDTTSRELLAITLNSAKSDGLMFAGKR